MAQTFRYQEFFEPSLRDVLRHQFTWTYGEAPFETLVERLRSGQLSPSKDLVFSEGAFRPFADAIEFIDVCPKDLKKRRQRLRSVTVAVIGMTLAGMVVAARLLLLPR